LVYGIEEGLKIDVQLTFHTYLMKQGDPPQGDFSSIVEVVHGDHLVESPSLMRVLDCVEVEFLGEEKAPESRRIDGWHWG
jgi:hypothetical protein